MHPSKMLHVAQYPIFLSWNLWVAILLSWQVWWCRDTFNLSSPGHKQTDTRPSIILPASLLQRRASDHSRLHIHQQQPLPLLKTRNVDVMMRCINQQTNEKTIWIYVSSFIGRLAINYFLWVEYDKQSACSAAALIYHYRYLRLTSQQQECGEETSALDIKIQIFKTLYVVKGVCKWMDECNGV